MNGVILSVPWRDHQEYGIIWDTSVLPMPLEKSAISHAIAKTDHQCINLLKMACFMFDKVLSTLFHCLALGTIHSQSGLMLLQLQLGRQEILVKLSNPVRFKIASR
jgi:hypothetical protein